MPARRAAGRTGHPPSVYSVRIFSRYYAPSTMMLPASKLFQAQDVLHIIESGFFSYHPLGRAYGPAGEHVAGMCPMGQLDPLAHADEIDRVFADDVPAADGLHADLLVRPGAGH